MCYKYLTEDISIWCYFITLYVYIIRPEWSVCSICKQLIQQIIDRGNAPHMGMEGGTENQSVVEMSIPGGKVGLVIGKGGETIRQLQVIYKWF